MKNPTAAPLPLTQEGHEEPGGHRNAAQLSPPRFPERREWRGGVGREEGPSRLPKKPSWTGSLSRACTGTLYHLSLPGAMQNVADSCAMVVCWEGGEGHRTMCCGGGPWSWKLIRPQKFLGPSCSATLLSPQHPASHTLQGTRMGSRLQKQRAPSTAQRVRTRGKRGKRTEPRDTPSRHRSMLHTRVTAAGWAQTAKGTHTQKEGGLSPSTVRTVCPLASIRANLRHENELQCSRMRTESLREGHEGTT